MTQTRMKFTNVLKCYFENETVTSRFFFQRSLLLLHITILTAKRFISKLKSFSIDAANGI